MDTYQIITMALNGLTLFGVSGVLIKFGIWKGTVDRELKHNKVDHIRFEREHTALEQEFHGHVAKQR